jgi:myxalamid-type polyketide synthase MxaB
MAEMVDAYIKAMRSEQPEGPYWLFGWSAGGIYAYETARRLREQGQTVAMLALVDTPQPSIYDNVDVEDPVSFLFDMANFANWFSDANIDFRSWSYEQLHSLDEDRLWQRALDIAKAHHAVPANASTEYLHRLIEASRSHARMIKSYTVSAFDQTVHLIRPENPDVLGKMVGQVLPSDLGWGDILGDRLRLHTSPGDHFSMILGDSAPSLARLLAALIEDLSAVPV